MPFRMHAGMLPLLLWRPLLLLQLVGHHVSMRMAHLGCMGQVLLHRSSFKNGMGTQDVGYGKVGVLSVSVPFKEHGRQQRSI